MKNVLSKALALNGNRYICAIAACVLLSAPLAAQDYDAGFAAVQSRDFETAVENWRPLAEQGDPRSQWGLGALYQNGWGVVQDHEEALRWYRLAADQGEVRAWVALGNMHRRGTGVPQDGLEAAGWYRMAAEQNNRAGLFGLADLYRNGEGVPQDYVLAHMWINIADQNGHDGAAFTRGNIEELMTTEQIAQAEERANACLASEYQDCD